MEYRKKVAALSCAIAALALVYAAAIVFDPARRGERADVYAWLDSRDAHAIGGITIVLPEGLGVVALRRSGSDWFVLRDGESYPARRARVNDFVAELSRRAPYPVRATSSAAHARLSLTEDEAARVVVSGAVGPPLLDLLVGQNDLSGRNVYMRRAGRNEVRSGEDRLSAFLWAGRDSWYNLMLFPENEEGAPGVSEVMRLTVRPPADGDGAAVPMVFTRAARNWETDFALGAVNSMRVDSYVRDILLGAGEGFADGADAVFADSSIVLEFADGGSATISFAAPDEDGRRLALVSGSGAVLSVSGWMHQRLFPRPETFGM